MLNRGPIKRCGMERLETFERCRRGIGLASLDSFANMCQILGCSQNDPVDVTSYSGSRRRCF